MDSAERGEFVDLFQSKYGVCMDSSLTGNVGVVSVIYGPWGAGGDVLGGNADRRSRSIHYGFDPQ